MSARLPRSCLRVHRFLKPKEDRTIIHASVPNWVESLTRFSDLTSRNPISADFSARVARNVPANFESWRSSALLLRSISRLRAVGALSNRYRDSNRVASRLPREGGRGGFTGDSLAFHRLAKTIANREQIKSRDLFEIVPSRE